MTAMIITIDGPAGAGKSTAARELARRLGFEFLDTGAMYRAVAWACLDQGIDLHDHIEVSKAAAGLSLRVGPDSIACNGRDVTAQIRSVEVSQAASIVAAFPDVRAELVRLQRETAAGRNMVTEGRDQGSVVFPDAECKFFLTAATEERARRRLKELEASGRDASLNDVLSQIIDRDNRDRNRPIGPLVKPGDALEVDSSDRPIGDIIAQMESIARGRLPTRTGA